MSIKSDNTFKFKIRNLAPWFSDCQSCYKQITKGASEGLQQGVAQASDDITRTVQGMVLIVSINESTKNYFLII